MDIDEVRRINLNPNINSSQKKGLADVGKNSDGNISDSPRLTEANYEKIKKLNFGCIKIKEHSILTGKKRAYYDSTSS